MKERQRKLALLGGLSGAFYLASNNLLPGVPDFLMGVVLGLSGVCFIMALLPDETARKIRKWKRRGE